MPDSGSNNYISIAPDGRVVTPNNLTPEGVAIAADLATHGDLDTLVSTYDLPDVAHLGDLPDLSEVAAMRDGGRIAGLYQLPLTSATAQIGDTFSADYDFSGQADNPQAWAEYVFAGEVYGTGSVVLVNVQAALTPTVCRFWFASMSRTVQAVNASYYFYAIGRP